mmetsp:Transcript_21966/g.32078  ORF Transcript_21966/g.32078 Transcript_21966/m.32078 type:complete len:212 (+) Transcript_21966:408-1043(+)
MLKVMLLACGICRASVLSQNVTRHTRPYQRIAPVVLAALQTQAIRHCLPGYRVELKPHRPRPPGQARASDIFPVFALLQLSSRHSHQNPMEMLNILTIQGNQCCWVHFLAGYQVALELQQLNLPEWILLALTRVNHCQDLALAVTLMKEVYYHQMPVNLITPTTSVILTGYLLTHRRGCRVRILLKTMTLACQVRVQRFLTTPRSSLVKKT